MLSTIKNNFVRADLAAVESLLTKLSPSNLVTRRSLEDRRRQLQDQLNDQERNREVLASSALFFSGLPVVGARGIDSDFAGEAITKYQDVVAKVFAMNQDGGLKQRGVVPGKSDSRLYVTRIVHGSFGFQFEELEESKPLFDSFLKESVDQTSAILKAFGETSDEVFDETITNIDGRILETVRNFFEFIQESKARFRVVSSNIDENFDEYAIYRAVERAKFTTLEESHEKLKGVLTGAIPTKRTFEYTTEDKEILTGRISNDIPDERVSQILANYYNKSASATIYVKSVLRQGNLHRRSNILESIDLINKSVL